MRIIQAIATLILMVSCSVGQKSGIDSDFGTVVNLDDGEIMAIPDFIERMDVRGNQIVLKISNKQQQACLMDIPGNSKHYFLAYGRGPGETTNLLDISFRDSHSIQASVDPESVMLFDIDSLINGKKVPEDVYRLAEGRYAFPNIVTFSNQVLYCGKNLEESENTTNYCIEDRESGSVQGFGSYPDDEITKRIPSGDYSLQTAYQAKIKTSPDNKYAVAYYFYMLGFDILDTINASVLSSCVYSPLGVKVTFNEEINANLVSRDMKALRGFLDAAVTERYIYLLASLKCFEDEDYTHGQEVYRYLWDGTPNRHFHVEYPTSSIGVSDDDRFLYTIKNERDHDSLVKFEIDNT